MYAYLMLRDDLRQINIFVSVANVSYYEIMSSEIDTQVILNIYYQRYYHIQNNQYTLLCWEVG